MLRAWCVGRSLTKVREEPYKYPGKEHSGKEGTAGAKAATRNEVVMTAGERVGRSGGGEGLGGARRPAHGRGEPAGRRGCLRSVSTCWGQALPRTPGSQQRAWQSSSCPCRGDLQHNFRFPLNAPRGQWRVCRGRML